MKLGEKGEQAEGDKAVDARKAQAEADLKRAKADEAQIKLAELEATMHRSEDVEHVLTDLVYFVRNSLIALPGRIAVDAANAKSAAEVSAIAKREVDAMLNELTQYGYNRDEFAKMVRERAGWETDGSDPGGADSESS